VQRALARRRRVKRSSDYWPTVESYRKTVRCHVAPGGLSSRTADYRVRGWKLARLDCGDACAQITHRATVHPIWCVALVGDLSSLRPARRVKDTEDAETAIEWERWRQAVDEQIVHAHKDAEQRVTASVRFRPPASTLLNGSTDLADIIGPGSPMASRQPSPVGSSRCRDRLRSLSARLVVVLLDGRLSLTDATVASRCDARLYMREEEGVLRKRWLIQQAVRQLASLSPEHRDACRRALRRRPRRLTRTRRAPYGSGSA
jgi:hypothetical protein